MRDNSRIIVEESNETPDKKTWTAPKFEKIDITSNTQGGPSTVNDGAAGFS